MSFGMIHEAIFDSSVADDYLVRLVRTDMTTLADHEDNARMSGKRLSRRTGVPLEIGERAVLRLSPPDPESKTTDHEGRRIIPLDPNNPHAGWHIVSRAYYKRLMSRAQRTQYMREYRETKRSRHTNGTKQKAQADLAGTTPEERAQALDEEFGEKK